MNFRTLKKIENIEEKLLNAIARIEALEKPEVEELPVRKRVPRVRKQKDAGNE